MAGSPDPNPFKFFPLCEGSTPGTLPPQDPGDPSAERGQDAGFQTGVVQISFLTLQNLYLKCAMPMKTTTIALTAAFALGLPSALMAGDAVTTTTATTGTITETAYGETPHWFIGGGVDYWVDSEEPFYNGHVGYDFGNGSALFVESGWIGQEETAFPFLVNIDIDVVPITFNYKYQYNFTERFGLYAGLGLGASNVDVSAGFTSDDDWVFTAQAFAGLVYNVSSNFEIYAGARYIWLDDVSLFGANVDDLDDVGVGGGVRFNF
jgi:opacity protein-like surface antigen